MKGNSPYADLARFITKNVLGICFTVAWTFTSQAQPLQLEWAQALFSSKTSFTTLDISELKVDTDGNTIVSGTFQGKADLDPGVGEVNIVSGKEGFAEFESFLAKYNSVGELVFGFKLDARIGKVILSQTNEILIVGDFDTIVDFNPAVGTNTLDGTKDRIFAVKYSKDGAYLGGFSVGQGSGVSVEDAALDSKGNLYIYGAFRDTVDLDPSGDKKNVTATHSNGAIFLAKYSVSNQLQFAFSIQSRTTNGAHELAIDDSDNIYLIGLFFYGSGAPPLDLDPGVGNTNFQGIGGVDGFWAKYNSEGKYLTGHLYDGNLHHIALDQDDNIYLEGSTANGMDVDLSSSQHLLFTDPGGFDQFLVKYASNLDLAYGITFKGNSSEMRVEEMSVDNHENVYLCGEFRDTIGFVKGTNVGDVISKGSRDAFVAKLDKEGKLKFAHSFGNQLFDEASNISLDNQGGIWVTGKFTDSINLNPEGNSGTLVNADEGGAVFLSKYKDASAVGVSDVKNIEDHIHISVDKGKLLITFSKPNPAAAQVFILGINGQVYKSINTTQINDLKIALSELPSNQMLIVKVRTPNAQWSRKVHVH